MLNFLFDNLFLDFFLTRFALFNDRTSSHGRLAATNLVANFNVVILLCSTKDKSKVGSCFTFFAYFFVRGQLLAHEISFFFI